MIVGEQVTLLHPRDDEPIILSMQRYSRVVAVLPNGDIFIQLSDTWPPNQRFGPFPPARFVRGWRDDQGRWR